MTIRDLTASASTSMCQRNWRVAPASYSWMSLLPAQGSLCGWIKLCARQMTKAAALQDRTQRQERGVAALILRRVQFALTD